MYTPALFLAVGHPLDWPNFGRVSVLPTITLEHLGSALGAKLWLYRSILVT